MVGPFVKTRPPHGTPPFSSPDPARAAMFAPSMSSPATDHPAPAPASSAVFLSYAHEDATAAQRIVAALRAAGIEAWFDQSELRGGDTWDQKIKKQIRECALFVPVISAHTNARAEGYFRLEWLLAVERSRLMADDAAFLVPVVIVPR